MSVVSYQLKGMDEVKRKLSALPRNIQNKAVRAALRESIDDMKNAVIANAPVKSGTLRKALVTKIASSRSFQGLRAMVIIRHGYYKTRGGKMKLYKNDAFYWRWIERGHRMVRKGKQYGYIPARKFIEHAFDAYAANAVTTVQRRLKEYIKTL